MNLSARFLLPLILLFLTAGTLSASPVDIEFLSDFYSFDNRDMKNYDHSEYVENQPYETLNTDDAQKFIISAFRLNYSKRYLNSEFFMKMRFEGFWGNDNMGENSENSAMFVDNMYTNTYFAKKLYAGIGRQNYSIGSAQRDYFFKDIIDGVVLNYGTEFMELPFTATVMTDITGMASRPTDTKRFYHIRKDPEEIDNFEGDTLSVRFGGNVSYWFTRLFYYYMRYGASESGGADIAQEGLSTVNEADGDYLSMGGGRLFYDFKRFGRGDFTFAFSRGYDFQYSGNHEYNGNAGAFNYRIDIVDAADFSRNIFRRLESVITMGYFSPKFCGMRADSFGDIILEDYTEYTPAPYAGAYHFYDYAKIEGGETYTDRSCSKKFIGISFSTLLRYGLFIEIGYLQLYANDRIEKGLFMGREYTVSLRYSSNNWMFSLTGNAFLPGEYYDVRSKDNYYIPAGKDPFWGVMCSFSSKFRIME